MEVYGRNKWRAAGVDAKRAQPDGSSPLGKRRGTSLLVVEVGDGLADGTFVEHGVVLATPYIRSFSRLKIAYSEL
jgi:hypothetical protein